MGKRSLNRRLAVVADRPLRYLAYIRVSATMGRGGDDYYTEEIQLAAVRKRTVGMREIDIICDIDETGTTFARDGIDKVLKLARAKAFDVLAVYNIKRFGRNTLEGLQTLNELADHGVTIISAKEHIDTSTPSGRKQLTDLLAGAQMQAEEIGEAWADVIERRAQEGKHHGHRLTGYKSVKGRMIPDANAAPIMTEVFMKFAKGKTTSEIMRYAAAALGRPIHISQVKRWVRNSAYAGRARLNGLEYDGAHEPLVDQDTWNACQDRLAREANMAPREKLPAWSLVGLVYCPRGCRLYRRPYRDETGERTFRLLCSREKSRLAGVDCDGIGTPLLEPVEGEVLRQALEHIRKVKSDVGARVAALSRRTTARVDAGALRRQVKEARDAIAKLTTAWARSQIGDSEYKASIAELRAAETVATQRLEGLNSSADAPDPIEHATATEALLMLWPEMLPDERNRAMKRIVKRVVVRRRRNWLEPEANRVQIGDDDWVF